MFGCAGLTLRVTFGNGNSTPMRRIRSGCEHALFNAYSVPFASGRRVRNGTQPSAHCSVGAMSASLIGRLGSSAFRLSITTVSMSLTGSCFSSESAPGPFHHGIRRRGGTIFGAALPLDKRQVQADIRSHLIHRPARDIIPPLGGPQCSPVTVDLARFMPLQRSWSIGTQCRLPRCGA